MPTLSSAPRSDRRIAATLTTYTGATANACLRAADLGRHLRLSTVFASRPARGDTFNAPRKIAVPYEILRKKSRPDARRVGDHETSSHHPAKISAARCIRCVWCCPSFANHHEHTDGFPAIDGLMGP